MVVERQFSSHGHTVRLAVERGLTGWNIQEECDSAVVHVEHCDDWHRVERTLHLLEMKAISHDFGARTGH